MTDIYIGLRVYVLDKNNNNRMFYVYMYHS